MAHFAQLDENNVVTQVIVVDNADVVDENGVEQEHIGVAFCQKLFGADTRWKQTSYNHSFRVRYAGVGYTYNEELDAFITPKGPASWTLDPTTAMWVPPVPYPNDGQMYMWDEDNLNWKTMPGIKQ